MAKKRKQPDAIEAWIEYQDHKFDPGYWAGRISPFSPGRRPNRSGYYLLAVGIFMMAALVLPILASVVATGTFGLDWSGMLAIGFFGGFAALSIASGLAVLRKPRRGNRTNG
jgi:hypothetical protein